MVGAGATVFALMSYVIARQVPDRTVGSQVELNPRLLAFILGEPEVEIVKAIEYLCAPDPESRSKAEGGRRLVKLGPYSYQVVNGAKYRAIRDAEARREQNREAQRRFREKQAGAQAPGRPGVAAPSTATAKERARGRRFERAAAAGLEGLADRIAAGDEVGIPDEAEERRRLREAGLDP